LHFFQKKIVRITCRTTVQLSFICAQKEQCPRTEKIHVQACLIAHIPITKAQWCTFAQKIFGNPVHVQERKLGNSEAARDYCLKDTGKPGERMSGTEPVTFGEFRETHGSVGQGERSDCSAVYSWMKDNPGATYAQCLSHFHETMEFRFVTDHEQWFSRTMRNLEQEKIRSDLAEELRELTLRDWQKEIVDLVSPSAGDPPTRTIEVIVDTVGGCGKSKLTSILSTLHGFVSLSLGKRDDLLHAFVSACPSFIGVRGVIIDIPMSADLNGIDSRISIWQTAEMLKNRQVTTTKYASATHYLPKMHVIVMTNQDVPLGAFGEGRLRIHHLTKTDLGILRRVENR
jgi:hypothetical protein